ncbi:MAG: flavodoxin family protein [Candidatus Hodarchaeota archaeon]
MGIQKILVVLGSPRKNGNTTILANQAIEGAKEADAEVENVRLQGLNIAPCNACDACRKSGHCTIDDDMIPLYDKIEKADAILLASPVYWFNMSAQMKLFIDRTYAVESNGRYALTGKRIGIIMAYADSDPLESGAINAIHSFQDMCRFVKADIVGIVHGCAEHPGEIEKRPEVLKAAHKLGKKLAGE